ncbi:MAG: hypothetical protein M3512_16410 [Bacteroidota bacterium]|nr:hypothetical protein [Bacteroidota bacterium]MDQ3537045.1 hypothetical protein [Bacteroidota bacterium]
MKNIKNFLLVLLLTSSTFSIAQRQVERNLILHPLNDTTKTFNGKRVSFAHNFAAFASFGKFVAIKDDDHEWYQQIGSLMELMRFRNNATLVVVSHMQLFADPNNNINLNPRAIFWEEGLFYSWQGKSRYYKAGYYHRCKHDVDNLTIGEERGLIFGSFLFETIIPVALRNDNLMLAFRNDLYTIRQDFRIPRHSEGQLPNLDRILTTFRGNFHYQKLFFSQLGLYINGYTALNIYSKNEGLLDRFTNLHSTNLSAGLSSGLVLKGNAQIRLGFNYEYLTDSNIGIPLQPTHLLSFGIMGISPFAIR